MVDFLSGKLQYVIQNGYIIEIIENRTCQVKIGHFLRSKLTQSIERERERERGGERIESTSSKRNKGTIESGLKIEEGSSMGTLGTSSSSSV